MGVSIEVGCNLSLAVRAAARRPEPPKKIILNIFPSKIDGGLIDPRQFYKDWDRCDKFLIFDNQSIYSKFKNDFDELNELDRTMQQIRDQQRANNWARREELQPTFDCFDTEYQEKNEKLKIKVEQAFNNYLESRLGPTRMHLKEEICWRFSMKALTAFYSLVAEESARRYQGSFQNGKYSDTVTLDIPTDVTQPVQITTTSEASYRSFFPIGKTEMQELASPVRLKGHAVYTIGLNGRTDEGHVEFTIATRR